MSSRAFTIVAVTSAALALFVAPGFAADPGAVSYLVPAIARVPGAAASLWRSDLVLHNPGAGPASVRLQYLERGRTNPSPSERWLVLEPGVSILIEDLLGTLFGVVDGAGALVVVADRPLAISSRTFNLTTDGDGLERTWGQFVPAIAVDSFAAASLHLLPQLTDNTLFRTNLGIVNLGYDDLLAWVDPDVFDGEDPKARIYRVPANGMSQINRPLAETGAPVDDAMISVDTDFLSGPFLAWASVVDNRSGDAIFVPPVEPLGGDVYIPAAAHAQGRNGAVWRTDLEVTGDPHLPVRYRLAWLPADTDNSHPFWLDFDLEPGQARRHVDVVGADLGATGAGALRVTMLVGQALITSRTYTATDAGTFGQFVAGQPSSAAASAGGGSILVHIRHSKDPATGYRSNVGVVNTSAVTLDVVADFFVADGSFMGTVELVVPPYGFHQLNGVVEGLTSNECILASAVVSTSTEGGSFIAYASVIDNRSNDPIFVPAQ